MKRILSMILAAMLLLGLLAGCGGASVNKDYVGVYKLSQLSTFSVEEYASMLDMELEEAKESMMVELKDDGSAVWTTDGEAESLKWKSEGETVTLFDNASDDTIEGTFADGSLTFDFDGETVILTRE